MRPVADYAVAAAWGGAEATVFFFVPDIWLSRIAMTNPKRALKAVLPTLAGAIAGGVATYRWSKAVGAERSRDAFATIPAISHAMVDKVDADYRDRGILALLSSFLRGEPYKLYARAAALQGTPLAHFAAWSVPARAVRFIAVPMGVAGLAALNRRRATPLSRRAEWVVFGAGWATFYAGYFTVMGRSQAAS